MFDIKVIECFTFLRLLFNAYFIYHNPNTIATTAPIIPSKGAAVKVVPKYLVGTTFCTDGVPGSIVIVNVPKPNMIGIPIKFQAIFNCLNNGLAKGTITKTTTNRLMPPYVKIAVIKKIATNIEYGLFVPTLLMIFQR